MTCSSPSPQDSGIITSPELDSLQFPGNLTTQAMLHGGTVGGARGHKVITIETRTNRQVGICYKAVLHGATVGGARGHKVITIKTSTNRQVGICLK